MDEPKQAGGHQRYLTNGEQQVHGNTPAGEGCGQADAVEMTVNLCCRITVRANGLAVLQGDTHFRQCDADECGE
ncbi:hypothetical protein ACI703_11350 [Isoptericola jiangsuensis]|uniref:hypothetical protein n=1 Tax=Isoptericola jiangsuensis TaxID=548579 RepID=UPI003868203C